jgi:hypothetical protein
MSKFAELKKQEAESRMQNIRKARKSRRAALKLQRELSWIDGSESRILNLRQVAKAMEKWT